MPCWARRWGIRQDMRVKHDALLRRIPSVPRLQSSSSSCACIRAATTCCECSRPPRRRRTRNRTTAPSCSASSACLATRTSPVTRASTQPGVRSSPCGSEVSGSDRQPRLASRRTGRPGPTPYRLSARGTRAPWRGCLQGWPTQQALSPRHRCARPRTWGRCCGQLGSLPRRGRRWRTNCLPASHGTSGTPREVGSRPPAPTWTGRPSRRYLPNSIQRLGPCCCLKLGRAVALPLPRCRLATSSGFRTTRFDVSCSVACACRCRWSLGHAAAGRPWPTR